MTGAKESLHQALRDTRAAMLSALDGLSEHDRRRPLTPTGTNLLGLVKHLVGVEYGYLGESFGRPPAEPLPWYADGSVWDGADMWATPEESTEYLVGPYPGGLRAQRRDARGARPGRAGQRGVVARGAPRHRPRHDPGASAGHTARHAGQADIVRELVHGRGGDDHDSFGDEETWRRYTARIADAAATFEH